MSNPFFMLKENDFLKTEFVKSITDKTQIPKPVLPEIAFAGRSNVGKSSLLNAIFQRRNLVKTSSTPGKTQLINYFNVNNVFYCVDLPGYGYAKIPVSKKAAWQKMLESYLVDNINLSNIYVLIDSRHDLQQNDIDMLNWLDHIGQKYTVVISKTDKINRNSIYQKLALIKQRFPGIAVLPFSIKDRQTVFNVKKQIITDLTQ